MKTEFIPGAELARLYFDEAVKPLLDEAVPGLRYDAALIDGGSEVLGFDTPMSTDHHWGPRVTLFLAESDLDAHAGVIDQQLRDHLPYEFRGYSTSFAEIPDEPGIMEFEHKDSGPVKHRISLTTLPRFMLSYLNLEWSSEIALEAADWLSFPQQRLATLTRGPRYHDGLGEVAAMQSALVYYPRHVWLYMLAAGWTRISQEEHFVGRTGDVADELGSRLIAARLVRDLMQLCFLMARQYAPYSKWFGSAFEHLDCAAALLPIFDKALGATDWQIRETHLSAAYSEVAALHNALGLTAALDTDVQSFFGRPYRVIFGGRFAEALIAQIADPQVRRIAQQRPIGSLDQFSDSTDLREAVHLRQRLKALYDA